MSKIDYERMQKVYPKQLRSLKLALETGSHDEVRTLCKEAVAEWNEIGCWPDEWSRWQRALNDTEHWSNNTRLEDL